MMGVYIKGFQLPEKSDMYYVKVECEAGKNPVAIIWRKDLLGEMSFGAFEVISVPPHGDLIDQSAYRDEFMDGVYDLCNDDPDNYRANAIIDLFDAAPTIVPAEEEAQTGPYDLLYEEGGYNSNGV